MCFGEKRTLISCLLPDRIEEGTRIDFSNATEINAEALIQLETFLNRFDDRVKSSVSLDFTGSQITAGECIDLLRLLSVMGIKKINLSRCWPLNITEVLSSFPKIFDVFSELNLAEISINEYPSYFQLLYYHVKGDVSIILPSIALDIPHKYLYRKYLEFKLGVTIKFPDISLNHFHLDYSFASELTPEKKEQYLEILRAGADRSLGERIKEDSEFQRSLDGDRARLGALAETFSTGMIVYGNFSYLGKFLPMLSSCCQLMNEYNDPLIFDFWARESSPPRWCDSEFNSFYRSGQCYDVPENSDRFPTSRRCKLFIIFITLVKNRTLHYILNNVPYSTRLVQVGRGIYEKPTSVSELEFLFRYWPVFQERVIFYRNNGPSFNQVEPPWNELKESYLAKLKAKKPPCLFFKCMPTLKEGEKLPTRFPSGACITPEEFLSGFSQRKLRSLLNPDVTTTVPVSPDVKTKDPVSPCVLL